MHHSPITHFTCVHVLVCLFFYLIIIIKYCFSHQLSGNRNMFSFNPNWLRKWRGGEGPRGVIQISSEGGDQRIFWSRKTWQAFFLGWLHLSRDFFRYSKQSEGSDGMMNKQTQTFIVHIFRVVSCKALKA